MRAAPLLTVALPLAFTFALAAVAGEPSAVLEDYGSAPTRSVQHDRESPRSDSSADPARRKGVAWIVQNQHKDGGWSSGSHGTDGMQAASDVATTAFSVLALLRDADGTSRHQEAVLRGTHFVLHAVETAPDGPRLNTPEGTQIQHKLGTLVDTHLAGLLLGEVAGKLDARTNARVDRALEVVVAKIQGAQNTDGSFAKDGWAPVLSSSLAAQSLNRAVELGKDVSGEVLARSDDYQAQLADADSNSFDASAGAGVELYAVATSLRGASQTKKRDKATTPGAVAQASEAEALAVQKVAEDRSGRLMAGFGSIGGEEMLSYMMISDSLAEKGGQEWKEWEARIGGYLAGIQNGDGSWVGHHCITSRAFTTAGAIMTLTAGDHAGQARSRG